ncbi:D-2-hydroxyacid dehydrogenase family protein [Undibacterium seohonense]|uniref:D-2-hydroxyacid dehydrogenase family protein n=1 Tax=Undibacterium seohonense TaxID=1344950 RepID=A0ABR6X887_9BURK|nr:D-2-hydroxyacid dehydrogenase family protein [Undibacterium seohonense]MBC3808948.1 D-2-hydroxyacid dehydrogenase family protein [Undibacterium seohonense]
MKIAILDDYQDVVRSLDCFNLLKEHEVKVFNNRAVGLGQLAIRLQQFEALVLIRERTNLNRALLGKLPNLKLISQTGKVSGNIDLEAAKKFGITVLEGIGDPTAPAELTWALIMASSRKISQYANLLQEGVWQMASLHPQHNQLGRVLKGRQLGIWGYGRIGKLVAGYGQAFGMQVIIWGSEASRKQALSDGLKVATSKQDFFASSDIISLHLRLNQQTKHIVQLEDLLSMKIDALLVNTSRAELIAPNALELAVNQGRPGWVALDVFENEPLAADSLLRGKDNILLTPHLGYVEKDSYELYFQAAFQNILRFCESRP